MYTTASGAPVASLASPGGSQSHQRARAPHTPLNQRISKLRPSQRKQHYVPRVSSSAGGPGGPVDGGARGFGGRGDDDDDDGHQQPPSALSSLIRGWNERVAADPEFTYKVFVEQVIGVGAAVIGDMSSRPYWGLYELDFVFSTLIVGSIVNLSLMYLLAPTAAAATGKSLNLIEKLFSDQVLRAWGAPTGHMFERGYPFASRVVNVGYKGFLFALVGMSAGLTGTAVSNTLLLARQKLDPNFKSQNEAPNVPLNAATWAAHMGISSNVRYQILNGIDMVAQPSMNPVLFKCLTSLLRTGNNVVGGISFVTLAKLFGVQSSKGDEVKQVAKSHHPPLDKHPPLDTP